MAGEEEGEGRGEAVEVAALEGEWRGGLVWAVSMAKQERVSVAWRVARKAALRRATVWKECSERRDRAAEEEYMESIRCQVEGGPMPPKVVRTHGRKVRPRSAEPAACLAVFSAARA